MEERINYYYNIKVLFKVILGYLAYFAVFPPFLPALLNKFRGVKICNSFKVSISPFVSIDNISPELITIENDVIIARGCYLLAHFNPTKSITKIMEISSYRKPVTIKEGAFLGVNSGHL